VPIKFTEFMEGRELREAILREVSCEGSPYEVEVYYDGDREMFFRGGCIKGGFCCSIITVEQQNSMQRSLMGRSARRNMKPKFIFIRISYL
jgi:hypothetical protein